MRVAVVHNQDTTGVINVFGTQNREKYSPETVERVAASLEVGGHVVKVIDGNMHVVEELRDFMPRVVAGERPGMVFNLAYGIQGVSRYTHLPAMLEMLGVPYVGSNPEAHALALDKVVAKMVFDAEGIPTPRFWNFASADSYYDDLTFPVIVKPKMEAVSFGIRVVRDWDELRGAVTHIIEEFDQHVLVEQFIPGREFAVALLGNNPPDVLPIVEIDLAGDPSAIQTAEEKLRAPVRKICPAELDDMEAKTLRELAQRSFESLGLHDFARIDVRMDGDGDFYVLEINSMASLGQAGSYVHAAKTAGYTYEGLINRMLDVAAIRYFGESYTEERERKSLETAAPAKLSALVRGHVRSSRGTAEDLLKRIVDMRTPVNDPGSVNALGELMMRQLKPLGFDCDAHQMIDIGNTLVCSNCSGEDPYDVLLLGHLDSAPVDRFQRHRGVGARLIGTGIAEHKGGLAVMMSALRALRFARKLPRIRVAILLTADETVGGARNRELVESLARRAHHVIGLKAGDLDGSIVLSRSGRSTYGAHLVWSENAEASSEAALRAVRNTTSRVNHVLRMNNVEAGIQTAVTDALVHGAFEGLPEVALGVTVRFNQPRQGPAADAEIRRIFKRAPRQGRWQVTGGMRRPPWQATEASDEFLKHVSRIAGELNLRIEGRHRWHSADLCFVPPGTPALDGFGPVGHGERTHDEHILRGSLVDRSALLALVIADCATTRGTHAPDSR